MAGDTPTPGPRTGPTPMEARTCAQHQFTGRLHQVLDQILPAPAWPLSVDELAETLTEAISARSRIDALIATLLADAQSRDLPTELGATNLVAWLKATTRQTPRAAKDLVALAQGLEDHDPTRTALAAGDLLPDQAAVIVAAVDALPDTVSPDEIAKAEEHLLAEAAHHDARELRALGKHLLDVIDPDAADERLNAMLEKEEREAARKTSFSGFHDGSGSYHFKGRMPSLDGAILESLLGAFLNPSRPDPIARVDEQGIKVATPELKGQALVQLVERYPRKRLPMTGGVNTTAVVLIPLECLEGRQQAAGILGTNLQVSAGQARRLACAGGLIPAVLGSDSQILDLGQEVRGFTFPQRIAMAVHQGGTCGIVECQRPATWCDGHHLIAWAEGGPTDLTNGALLCPRHHTLAHDLRFELTQQPTGGWKLVRLNRRQ